MMSNNIPRKRLNTGDDKHIMSETQQLRVRMCSYLLAQRRVKKGAGQLTFIPCAGNLSSNSRKCAPEDVLGCNDKLEMVKLSLLLFYFVNEWEGYERQLMKPHVNSFVPMLKPSIP